MKEQVTLYKYDHSRKFMNDLKSEWRTVADDIPDRDLVGERNFYLPDGFVKAYDERYNIYFFDSKKYGRCRVATENSKLPFLCPVTVEDPFSELPKDERIYFRPAGSYREYN